MPGPRAEQILQMPHPRDWQSGQMPRSSPGEGGGGGRGVQLELTDALLKGKILLKSKFDIATHVETGFATR